MTSSKELLELAERCEAATGPDRELDAAISEAFYPGDKDMARAFRPTKSLDSAILLPPLGEFICVDGPRKYLNIPTPVPNYWRACIGYAPEHRGWGALPTLALTAASLRARSAQGNDHE
jgi:hypothetical protein